jgi:hypothetical protein
MTGMSFQGKEVEHFFLLAWHGEGTVSFCEAKGGWLIVYLETKGTGKALVCSDCLCFMF